MAPPPPKSVWRPHFKTLFYSTFQHGRGYKKIFLQVSDFFFTHKKSIWNYIYFFTWAHSWKENLTCYYYWACLFSSDYYTMTLKCLNAEMPIEILPPTNPSIRAPRMLNLNKIRVRFALRNISVLGLEINFLCMVKYIL